MQDGLNRSRSGSVDKTFLHLCIDSAPVLSVTEENGAVSCPSDQLPRTAPLDCPFFVITVALKL